MDNNLDPTILAAAKAIKYTETGQGDTYNTKGASGEFGAYQFMPNTYKNYAQKYLGDAHAAPTMENQNKITYSFVKDMKDKGFSPAQIFSMWNAGEGKPNAYKEGFTGTNDKGVKFDTPAYVQKASNYYSQLKQPTPSGSALQPPVKPDEPTIGNPLFEATPNEGVGAAALKTAGNLPSSAFNFIKSALNMLNPATTLNTLGQIPQAFKDAMDANDGSALETIKNTLTSLPASAYKALVPQAFQHLFSGDTVGAQQDFTNDPVGQIAPFLLAAEGGAKLADNFGGGLETAAKDNFNNFGETGLNVKPKTGIYQDALDNGISKIASPFTDTGGKALSYGVDGAGKILSSAASYVTGLDTKTISNILDNPEAFSKIAQDQVDRGGIAGEVKAAIDQRIADLSETGKGYELLRNNPEQSPVVIPMGGLAKIIKDAGYDIVATKEEGSPVFKIKVTPESPNLSATDRTQLENFLNVYGKESKLTPNGFLNARGALSELAKYDATKSGNLVPLAREMRSFYDKLGKDQIVGLKHLDETYAPETRFLKQIKKDYLNKDGSFKDGAINKIANSTGKGKDAILARLENVLPNITKRIELLKAIEDIAKANDIKSATYGKIAVGAGGYLAGGITGAILAEIISNPKIAVPLIRGLGFTKAQIVPLLQGLKGFAGDVNTGKILKRDDEVTSEAALSTEGATRAKTPVDLNPTAQKAFDAVAKVKADAPKGMFNPTNPEIFNVADSYVKESGIGTNEVKPTLKLNEKNSMSIADAYDKMKDDPTNPKVQKAYDALMKETKAQYDYMVKAGYKIEPYPTGADPYKNSAEMTTDLRENKHLYYFPTDAEGLGKAASEDHPYMKPSGVIIDGKEIPFNDLFRAVHDFYGHAKIGNGFGAIGEENAWRQHSAMFSDDARRAMTTETRGQNSWVNFGKQLRDESGKVIQKGEKGYVAPPDRAYAEQKTGLLPDKYVFPEKTKVEAELPKVKMGNKTTKPAAPLKYPKNLEVKKK